MFRKNLSPILLFILAVAAALSAQTAKRPFKLDDLARLRDVRDPQLSPDGQWVAYVVATIDAKEDKGNTHIWMVGYDGKNDRQITFSTDSESAPRWSPDGKYLFVHFVAARAKPRAVRCGCSIAVAAKLISSPS